MVTSTNHVIAEPDLHRARLLALWRFLQHLSAKYTVGEDQKKFYDFSSGPLAGTQARSQKFAMGGLFWGSGGGVSSARKFCMFLQNELIFRAILIENNAFKTWHKNWQPNMT